jgi:phosphatidylserine/phosphatidylglycerophosphate/cardiolipin synthase-like enzyme
MDLTGKGLDRTADFAAFATERRTVRAIAELFEQDRAGRPAKVASRQVIVGPEGARPAYEALLAEARTSIQIIDHKLSDPKILDLLTWKARRGVRVEVVGTDRLGKRAHGKLVIVDRQTAIVGSIALSPVSLDQRRELGLIVRHPEPLDTLSRYFDRISPPRTAPWGGALLYEAV